MLYYPKENYDTAAYSNSSCLICVFNPAKDKANSRFKPFLKPQKDSRGSYDDYRFFRLNSSIVEVKTNIFNIINLIKDVSESTTHYSTLQIASLNVYFIVHPDTLSKFGFIGKYPQLRNLYIYTYDNFFSEVVGSLSNVHKHHKFLKSLSDSIFIFEDTSWFVLQVAFKYSLMILSGGSNTKRQFLSAIEFRMSQFLMATFYMSKVDIYKNLTNAVENAGVGVEPIKALMQAARELNFNTIKLFHLSYSEASSYSMSDVEVTNYLRFLDQIIKSSLYDEIYAVLSRSKIEVIREKPGYKFYVKTPSGESVQVCFPKDFENSLDISSNKNSSDNKVVGKGITGVSTR